MPFIQTVRGRIHPSELGVTLIHEHVMCDFVGADQTGPHRWDREAVAARMLPYLQAVAAQGVSGFGDCSPRYIGRDPLLLRRLSELSGMHIVTNTGFYKAPYLPPWVDDTPAEELAEHWIAEWEEGIEGTGVRPGFVKIAVNPGPLLPVQRKIVRAAALTHLATGLTVASHTGHAVAARESLDIVEAAGMAPSRYIVVHANSIANPAEHDALAARGAWLEYDGIGPESLDWHLALVRHALERGYAGQVLLSHDAGWYSVGEPQGGEVRPYTDLMARFAPLLHEAGVGEEVVRLLLVENPRRALEIDKV
jgi:phosphotriesterase-related protein